MDDNRTLTDADVQAISDALRSDYECRAFTEDDRHDIRTLLKIYRESTSAIRRGFIALVLFGALVLFIIGASSKLKIGG